VEKAASRPGVEVATLISRIREGLTNSEELHLLSERLCDTHAPSGTGRVAESLQQVIDQPIKVKMQFPWHYAGKTCLLAVGITGEEVEALAGKRYHSLYKPRGGAGGGADASLVGVSPRWSEASQLRPASKSQRSGGAPHQGSEGVASFTTAPSVGKDLTGSSGAVGGRDAAASNGLLATCRSPKTP